MKQSHEQKKEQSQGAVHTGLTSQLRFFPLEMWPLQFLHFLSKLRVLHLVNSRNLKIEPVDHREINGLILFLFGDGGVFIFHL